MLNLGGGDPAALVCMNRAALKALTPVLGHGSCTAERLRAPQLSAPKVISPGNRGAAAVQRSNGATPKAVAEVLIVP